MLLLQCLHLVPLHCSSGCNALRRPIQSQPLHALALAHGRAVRCFECRERAGVPGCRLHDAGRTLCGIVAFSLAGVPAADVRARLHERGMNVWVSKSSSTLLDFQARPCAANLQALTRSPEMAASLPDPSLWAPQGRAAGLWAAGLCRFGGVQNCMSGAATKPYPTLTCQHMQAPRNNSLNSASWSIRRCMLKCRALSGRHGGCHPRLCGRPCTTTIPSLNSRGWSARWLRWPLQRGLHRNHVACLCGCTDSMWRAVLTVGVVFLRESRVDCQSTFRSHFLFLNIYGWQPPFQRPFRGSWTSCWSICV